jgi:hypothetical protein
VEVVAVTTKLMDQLHHEVPVAFIMALVVVADIRTLLSAVQHDYMVLREIQTVVLFHLEMQFVAMVDLVVVVVVQQLPLEAAAVLAMVEPQVR